MSDQAIFVPENITLPPTDEEQLSYMIYMGMNAAAPIVLGLLDIRQW